MSEELAGSVDALADKAAALLEVKPEWALRFADDALVNSVVLFDRRTGTRSTASQLRPAKALR